MRRILTQIPCSPATIQTYSDPPFHQSNHQLLWWYIPQQLLQLFSHYWHEEELPYDKSMIREKLDSSMLPTKLEDWKEDKKPKLAQRLSGSMQCMIQWFHKQNHDPKMTSDFSILHLAHLLTWVSLTWRIMQVGKFTRNFDNSMRIEWVKNT